MKRVGKLLFAVFFAWLALGWADFAAADEPQGVRLAAALNLPRALAAEFELGLIPVFKPYVSLGWVPRPAIEFATQLITDQDVRYLVQDSIQSSMNLQAGFRLFLVGGLYLFGAYEMIGLGGGATSREALTAAGYKPPKGIELPDNDVTAESTIHGLNAGLGYRISITDWMSLGLDLGWYTAFSASTTVDAGSSKLNSDLTGYLNNLYVSYLQTPTLNVSFGFEL